MPPPLKAIGRVLTFTQRAAMTLGEKKLANQGLTITHWIILTALWRQDGMSNGELAEYCKAKDAALSRALDRMIKQGLIERRPDTKDRRVVRMYLTPKSRGMSHLLDFYKAMNELLFEGFSKQEQEMLFSMLERVLDNCQRGLED